MREGDVAHADDGSPTGAPSARAAVEALVERYDAAVFDVGRPSVRLRVLSGGRPVADVIIEWGQARLADPGQRRPDAKLSCENWDKVVRDGGLAGFRSGRVRIAHDLHLGVGFLAATSPPHARSQLRMRQVRTSVGRLSITEAGRGFPVVAIHGLGATKASFLPTVAALGREHRTIALDLPGFGDSVKPIGAGYDPPFFARSIIALLDALEIDRAHLVGNSMGGRVALETALRHPDRVGRLGLLSPSLAWLRSRPWAPLLRVVPTQLGLIQPAPRALVERIVRHVVPAAEDRWTAAGIDEFLRSYLTARGRAAFYAAARNIYMEEPHGPRGFWTRLPELEAPSLWVWGHRDTLVPIGFARHVRRVLPASEHLELPCGHVPQLECPRETHGALGRFLAGERVSEAA